MTSAGIHAAGTAGGSYVALCGGVGGAKLALGLANVLPADKLSIIVNTGDDFEHLGLHVSPDIDTVLYTLAGLSNAEQGWGLAGETWNFMGALERLGGPTWFRLGDQDLATHIERTERLKRGDTLTAVTDHLRRKLGIAPAILPMTDDPVATFVTTDAGRLPFQSYFVAQQCRPRVTSIEFQGAAAAKPTPAALSALARPDLAGLIICPSNPWLSVDPMLAIPSWRKALSELHVPRVAVTPIIGGRAIKGPTAKIMSEFGLDVSAASIAAHYRGLIDGFMLDESDAAQSADLGLPAMAAPTIMRTLDDRIRLARATIAFCRSLSGSRLVSKGTT